jgi:hypothetical protein
MIGRRAGVLLMLPLAGALVMSAAWAFAGVGCGVDCGDAGRGYFVLVLLCTPPAAVGVLALGGRAPRLAVGAVMLCTLALIAAAIAAAVSGFHELTTEPQVHRLGQTEPSQFDRDQAREAGIFWLVIAAVLTTLAAVAAFALRAAWQKRRRSRSG